MVAESLAKQLDSLPRRSFASLMELYENNYIFMRRLAPRLARNVAEGGCEYVVSSVADGVDLHMHLVDRHRYTTSILLTHFFRDGKHNEALPDVKVRIYHDARVAEVMPDSNLAGFTPWRENHPPEPGSMQWRWEVNRFLNRWLRYCLGIGHALQEDPGA